MPILFAGNETESLSFHVGCDDRAEGNDSVWVPSAIHVAPVSTNYFNTGSIGSGYTDIWFHFDMTGPNENNITSGNSPVNFVNSSSTFIARLLTTATNQGQMQIWNGSSWVSIGTTFALSGTRQTMDIRIFINGASSIIAVYRNQILVMESVGDYSAFTDIALALFQRNGDFAGRGGHYSQIIIADEPTLTFKYKSDRPTGNSATNLDWTGDYSDIDEITLNTADGISSSVNDDVSTFTAPSRSFDNYSIKTVVVTGYGLRGASGPSQIQGALRVSGTNYFGATQSLSLSYSRIQEYWDTNPDTGIAWTPSEAGSASLEFGFKSIA